ncbi:MAG: ribonuclease Z [Anaeromyxobacteraceae bacterium]
MSLLRLTFLGTSAAQPTASRGLSGLAVRRGGELLLFDCGEGTQRQMIRYGTGFDLAAIFFTHFHADHYLGAIGFLRTLSMLHRDVPLRLYGPRPARRLLEVMLFTGADALSFAVEIHELAPGDAVRLAGAEVRAFATDHRTPSLGYALVEDPRPGRFHPDRAAALGVPSGPLYGELQRGRPVEVDGRTVRPEDVVEPSRRGRTLVVSGDTRPTGATVEASRGADLLVHEATFGDAEAARALETLHSTAREAGRVAREAGAGSLVLTHLSTRYDQDPSPLVAQAREEFGAVSVAHDGLVLELPLPA